MSLLLLVRHGQASLTGADYDNLSELGERQSTVVGTALGLRQLPPTAVVQGSMRRHQQTADALLRGSHWQVPVETDPRWNEFDHDNLLLAAFTQYPNRQAMVRAMREEPDPHAAFQDLFLKAVKRWVAGQDDGDYPESFNAFVERITAAATDLATRSGTVLVSTSGGPIAVLAALAVLGPDAQPPEIAQVWGRFNEVCVNTGVSKFAAGRRPVPTLLTFNDHSHLELDRSLVTYR